MLEEKQLYSIIFECSVIPLLSIVMMLQTSLVDILSQFDEVSDLNRTLILRIHRLT